MSKHSYAVVPSATAREMAQDTLERIKLRREKETWEYVDEVTARLNGSWFRRLLRLKPLTRQDVYDRENHRSWESVVWRINNLRYLETEDLAKEVLVAAKHGDPLHLSLRDVNLLSP